VLATEYFGDVKPELSVVTDLRSLTLSQMRRHVEAGSPARLILLPFRFQLIPMPVRPAGDREIELVVPGRTKVDQLLSVETQIYARKPEILGTEHDQFLVNYLCCDKKGMVATVTTASVSEAEKMVFVGVTDDKGVSHILREPMSDEQLAEFRAYPDVYFGQILPVP
jgi:hypothetical protein